jgi:hypothetical protein
MLRGSLAQIGESPLSGPLFIVLGTQIVKRGVVTYDGRPPA